MNMDDLFKNIYSSPQIEAESDAHAQFVGASVPREDVVADKSQDPVWKGIAAGASEKITLEEFLMNKTGADVDLGNQAGVYAPVDPAVINGGQFSGFVNNGGGERPRLVGPGGRGKRRAVEEPPVDKATQQKQKRMIKNRESAARSRERKQAYTVELESLVTQLEEENAALLRDEVEQTKKRFKQLMETLIPVDEKPRQPRALKRMNSV